MDPQLESEDQGPRPGLKLSPLLIAFFVFDFLVAVAIVAHFLR